MVILIKVKEELRNTKWIPVFGYCDPNTRGVARLEKKCTKNTSRWASVFSFSKVEQDPECLDHSIQTRESIWCLFYKMMTDEKQLT